MHFVDAKGILSAKKCGKNGIVYDVGACFAYLQEFPQKYEQLSLL